MPVTEDKVIEAFIKTRDLLAEKAKVFKESIADLKTLQANREKWLLGQLNTRGVESSKTKFGTSFIKWTASITVEDPKAFLAWIHEDWDKRKHFLTNHCSKEAVKQRLDDKKALPSGVKHVKVKIVQVRRA